MACSGLVYLLLLLQILDVQSVVQNVTRRNEPEGDIFSNPDGDKCSSNFCWKYKGIVVGGRVMQTDNCKCSCYYHNTFVVHNTTCVDNDPVHSNLLASLQAKDASLRVTHDSNPCPQYDFSGISQMPVLDISRPSKHTLCLFMTKITKCNIIKKDSKYFYNGTWYPIWPTNRKQDTFNITEDEDDSFLEWTSLGQQFTGLIFGLKISCQLKSSLPAKDTLGSYLIFKSAGSHYFNGVKPTLVPISSAPTSEAKGPSPTPQSSITTSPSDSSKGSSSSSSNDKGLIAGITITVILIVIVIIVLVVLFLRRRRNSGEEPPEGAKTKELEENQDPIYAEPDDPQTSELEENQHPIYAEPDDPQTSDNPLYCKHDPVEAQTLSIDEEIKTRSPSFLSDNPLYCKHDTVQLDPLPCR